MAPDIQQRPHKVSRKQLVATHAVVASASRGAASIIKTQLLRQDRVTHDQHEQRLNICLACPGGHVTFRKNGDLHTCGPMLRSMGDPKVKTCGCVLNKKAWDAKESCPFGYWPTIESRPVSPYQRPGAIVAASAPGLPVQAGATPPTGMDRRVFLGRSIAAMTAAALGGPYAFGQTPEKYLPVDPCPDSTGSGEWVKCSDVEGREGGEVFSTTSGDCYQLIYARPKELSELPSDAAQKVVEPVAWFESCSCCEGNSSCSESSSSSTGPGSSSSADPGSSNSSVSDMSSSSSSANCCPCGNCEFSDQSTLEVNYSLSTDNGFVVHYTTIVGTLNATTSCGEYSGNLTKTTWKDPPVNPSDEPTESLEAYTIAYNCSSNEWGDLADFSLRNPTSATHSCSGVSYSYDFDDPNFPPAEVESLSLTLNGNGGCA